MTEDEAAEILAERRAKRQAACESLAEFVRQAWHVVEPGTKLVWNWHLDVICAALERQARGDESHRKLLICIPPGSMKSLLVSVFAPAWEWLHCPERRKIFLANDDALAVRDSRRMREVVTSDWYRALIRDVKRRTGRDEWELASDQNQKVNFENTRRGFRQCLSVGAAVTGKRSDDIVIDDPIDAKAVVNGSGDQVAKRLQEIANIVDKVLPSRVNNLSSARWTVIMQRLHEDDTAGRAMREGGWHVVNLQMEFDPGHRLNHASDPRRSRGELMFSELFPLVELERLKSPDKLGSRHYSAQYQQTPKPEEGTYIQRAWYDDGTRYDVLPPVNKYLASDLAVTEPGDGREPDYTEHGLFGAGPNDGLFVADWWHGQTTPDKWIDAGLDMVAMHKPLCWFLEAGVIRRAVEPFLLARMRERKVYCRIEWIASIHDKATRGRAFQARSAMRRIHFPRRSTWAERIVDQCVDFPGGKHDDAFDVLGLMCRVIDQAHPAIMRIKSEAVRDAWADAPKEIKTWKTA